MTPKDLFQCFSCCNQFRDEELNDMGFCSACQPPEEEEKEMEE